MTDYAQKILNRIDDEMLRRDIQRTVLKVRGTFESKSYVFVFTVPRKRTTRSEHGYRDVQVSLGFRHFVIDNVEHIWLWVQPLSSNCVYQYRIPFHEWSEIESEVRDNLVTYRANGLSYNIYAINYLNKPPRRGRSLLWKFFNR